MRKRTIGTQLAMEASIDLIEAGCEGDEAGPPTGRLKAAELRHRCA